jgi:hypothetical protein
MFNTVKYTVCGMKFEMVGEIGSGLKSMLDNLTSLLPPRVSLFILLFKALFQSREINFTSFF